MKMTNTSQWMFQACKVTAAFVLVAGSLQAEVGNDELKSAEKEGLDTTTRPKAEGKHAKRPHRGGPNAGSRPESGAGAGEGRKHNRDGKPMDVRRKMEDLAQADLNKNGMIEFVEFSSIKRLELLDDVKRRSLYDYLDVNDDGVLQSVEFRPKRPRWLSSLREDFSRFDKDQSDDVSLEEFAQIPFLAEFKPAVREKLFGEIDGDRNGAVTVAELGRPRRGRFVEKIDFSIYDNNTSGGLDQQEYLKLPFIHRIPKDRVESLFKTIDANNDGELSSGEFKEHHQKRMHGRKPR